MTFGTSGSEVRVCNDDLSQAEILQECARLPRGALWTDKRFAADSPTTLYVTGEPTQVEPFNGGSSLRWLRPHEIPGADAAQIDLIKDGLAAGDVAQGELGDCYLLGAMSSIAARKLLDPLIKPGVDPVDCISKGFLTFLLYKFGEWVEVSVDTLIPCNEQGHPVFAHGKDPNELWVPLLEKAYAKLHGSYEALDGGSVTAALVDLTGGVGESIDMTDDDTRHEIIHGQFWKRLRRYNEKGVPKGQAPPADGSGGGTYLLGAALSRSDVEDKGGHGSMQVTDQGILVNHAYSLIDVQEVGDGDGRLRLVQLRNPWGMKEWEGPWSDNAPEWETGVGVRAREKLGVTFGDDGTFWMSYDDFQQHFNKIYVCRIFSEVTPARLPRGQRPPPGAWYRYEIEGEWTEQTAGGCFNFPEWRRNPQYEIRTGGLSTQAVFLLMQPDPRTVAPAPRRPERSRLSSASDAPTKLGGDDGGPSYDKKIGMYIMNGDETYRRKVLFDSEEIAGDEVVDSTPFMAYRDVTCNTMDEEGEDALFPDQRYVLIPSTFAPGPRGVFRIVVLTLEPLRGPPEFIPPLKAHKIDGAWTDANAGGCRNFYTWRKNEQYHLQLSRPARVSVVLCRHNPDAHAADHALHSKKKTVKSKSKKKKAKDADNFLIGFVVAQAGEYVDRKLLRLNGRNWDDDGGDIIDKTQFSPNFEVAAEFVAPPRARNATPRDGRDGPDPGDTRALARAVYGRGGARGGGGAAEKPLSYVIVPSTFEPHKHSDFELWVYTDDERAQVRRIEPSTWHHHALAGNWAGLSAGGCRNHPSWVRNPIYLMRASRTASCELFLRQQSREVLPEGGGFAEGEEDTEYEGIGFYVTVDDGSLSLDDVRCQSGFRQAIETHKPFSLEADTPYLLIPMTYKKGVEMPYDIEVYCDQPSLRVEELPKPAADARRAEQVEHEAARTIVRWLVVKRIWSLLRRRPPDRTRASRLMVDYFSRPVRDNDEGYLDINLALNALESAYIQLTGNADAKEAFFPEMRKRLRARGHKIADYDVLL